MEKKDTPEQLHSTPIDGALIAPSLSKEFVTPGRIRGFIDVADNILALDGVETAVNGVPAVVSRFYVPVKMPLSSNNGQEQQFYARAARYKDPVDTKQKSKALPHLVFDETSNLPVITPNPHAVRFEELFKGPALVVDMSELDPEVNNPEHAEFVRQILLNISQGVHAIVEAREAKERNRQELANKQRQAQKEQEQVKRKNRRQYRIRQARDIGGKVLAGALGLGLVGSLATGVIYGIGKLDFTHEDYDERQYAMGGGTELTLGGNSSGHPEFSRRLYEDQLLATHTMPQLSTSANKGSGVGSSIDLSLDPTDTLRQIILISSKAGKNCASAKVDRVPLDTRLVAWTDFAGPDGNSRADELNVTYETGQVRVCWNGEERGPNDDPRVVVALRPADQSRPR